MNVQLNADFAVKNETYSLLNIFNNDERRARYYENGSIASVFFSAIKYHWYHAPVEGAVVHIEKIHGIINAIDELNQNKYNQLQNGTEGTLLDNWIRYGGRGLTFTQAYLAHVATRCIIEMKTKSVSKEMKDILNTMIF